jgi:hypothetical protein
MNRALIALAVAASLITGCATTSTRRDDLGSFRRDEQGSQQQPSREDFGLVRRDERTAALVSPSQSQSSVRRTGSTASRR